MNASGPARVAIVTGSRAEYGLLRPVMRAVAAHQRLELLVVAAGSHLVEPAMTIRDVQADFPVADTVVMQTAGKSGRAEDVEAVGRGIVRFGRVFETLNPDWVVVLGDRIEAFAAATAASIGGRALAHIHGGDCAEGVADEAMRHAITKLAHLHFPATERSRDRILKMGERREHVHCVGSPAIDALADIPVMNDRESAELGEPRTLLLMHPSGLPEERERGLLAALIRAVDDNSDGPVLALAPNLDPGRQIVLEALRTRCADTAGPRPWRFVEHLPRERFVGLLKRLALLGGGLMVGNSSAALIEGAAIGLRAVNVGPRQSGRERAGNVVDLSESELLDWEGADSFPRARVLPKEGLGQHPYGDGRAGERIADMLSRTDPHDPGLLRKHCTY